MRQPAVILAVPLAGVPVAVVLPGWSDPVHLGGPCAVAAAYPLLRASRRRPSPGANGRQIVPDGPNVMPEAFPEVRQPGRLIRNGCRGGRLRLDPPADRQARDAKVA